MKTLISLIVSFFMIFNINSVSYANNIDNSIGFTTNIINFSFDSHGINYQNNNYNKINNNEFLEYSLQFGVSLLTTALTGFTAFFIGSNLTPKASMGVNVTGVLLSILFSMIFSSIMSALGINIYSKLFLEREGNIWITMLIGFSSFLVTGFIFAMMQVFTGDFSKQYIGLFSLLSIVAISEVVAVNLTSDKKQILEESL